MVAVCAFVLMALGAARITRLITHDRILLGFRKALIAKFGAGHWIPFLVNCPLCIATWTTLPASILWMLVAHLAWWWAILAWPAMSYLVAPLLLRLEGD